MTNFLAIEKTKFVLTSLFMLVFGILFIALPQASYDVLTTVLSWMIIVFGAILCLHFLINPKVVPWTNIVSGLATILIGIFLLIFPTTYLILIAILLIVEGVIYISNSIAQNKAGVMGWWKDLICGIVQVVLGVSLFIVNYTAATSVVMIYLGILLIVDSIFILCAMCLIKNDVKQIKKQIENK